MLTDVCVSVCVCCRPKSPPNSPNPEFATDLEELRDYYLNKVGSSGEPCLAHCWRTVPCRWEWAGVGISIS